MSSAAEDTFNFNEIYLTKILAFKQLLSVEEAIIVLNKILECKSDIIASLSQDKSVLDVTFNNSCILIKFQDQENLHYLIPKTVYLEQHINPQSSSIERKFVILICNLFYLLTTGNLTVVNNRRVLSYETGDGLPLAIEQVVDTVIHSDEIKTVTQFMVFLTHLNTAQQKFENYESVFEKMSFELKKL